MRSEVPKFNALAPPPTTQEAGMAGGKWNEDYLRHMCKLSSVTAHMICSEGFDPTDIGPEPKMNVVNMYRILAKTFIELQARAGMKPRFVKNPQHCEQHGGRDG